MVTTGNHRPTKEAKVSISAGNVSCLSDFFQMFLIANNEGRGGEEKWLFEMAGKRIPRGSNQR
jgi:hypothetical protein